LEEATNLLKIDYKMNEWMNYTQYMLQTHAGNFCAYSGRLYGLDYFRHFTVFLDPLPQHTAKRTYGEAEA